VFSRPTTAIAPFCPAEVRGTIAVPWRGRTWKKILRFAIGILGAMVMPHNLYLRSSIVQTRLASPDERGRREAIHFTRIDCCRFLAPSGLNSPDARG
jgi:manganese transport protein